MKKQLFILMALLATAFASGQIIPDFIPSFTGQVWIARSTPPSNPQLNQVYLRTDGIYNRWNGSSWVVDVVASSSGGGTPQTLSIAGDQLSLSGANTVTIPLGTGGTNTTTNATSFKPITTDTYTLKAADRSTSQQSLVLLFTNPNGCTVSENPNAVTGEQYRLRQHHSSGKVKTDFQVAVTIDETIFAQTIEGGSNIILEILDASGLSTITGAFEVADGSGGTARTSIYDGQDAADPNPDAETNSTAGVSQPTGTTGGLEVVSTTDRATDGQYALRFTQTAADNTRSTVALAFPTETGATYTINFDGAETLGETWEFWTRDDLGFTTNVATALDGATMTPYTHVTSPATGTLGYIRFGTSAIGDTADRAYLDNIVITKNP